MIWKNLRVSEEVLVTLQRYRDKLQVTVNNDPKRFVNVFPDGAVSLGGAITYLLRQQQGHRARSQKAKGYGGRPKDEACGPSTFQDAESEDDAAD